MKGLQDNARVDNGCTTDRKLRTEGRASEYGFTLTPLPRVDYGCTTHRKLRTEGRASAYGFTLTPLPPTYVGMTKRGVTI